MSSTDGTLQDAFDKLASGDLEALEAVWAGWSMALHNYAFALTGSQDEADDVLGEVMARLARHRRKLRGVRSPKAYLFTMARNVAMSRARRIGRQAGEGIEDCAGRMTETDEAVVVREAVLNLPREQREAVVLHIWGGLTFAEVGRVTGTSPNTAAGRYRYALHKLRQTLGGEDNAG